MKSGISNTQKYLVPLITNDRGEATAVHLYHRPNLGKVLWLFSSKQRGDAFISTLDEENKAYMEVLEQGWGRYKSEDLNFGRFYSEKTVPELLPMLEKNDVDCLVVDPGFPGEQQRIYKSPHKS